MRALLAALIFAAGLAAGWLGADNVWRAQAATEHTTQAAAALQTLQAAQRKGDTLSAALARKEQQISQLQKDKRDAVKLATMGRPCLDGPALRLLGAAPGLRLGSLPETSGSAAATDAAVASDTDIAGWVIDAGAQYEQCRERLGALIDWHTPTPTTLTHEH